MRNHEQINQVCTHILFAHKILKNVFLRQSANEKLSHLPEIMSYDSTQPILGMVSLF